MSCNHTQKSNLYKETIKCFHAITISGVDLSKSSTNRVSWQAGEKISVIVNNGG